MNTQVNRVPMMTHHDLPDQWQRLPFFTLSVGQEGIAQAQQMVMTALYELSLPAAFIVDLVSVINTALLALAVSDCQQQLAATFQATIEILMHNSRARRFIAPGWGFFLVEKRANPDADGNGSPPHRLTVYLYQENVGMQASNES